MNIYVCMGACVVLYTLHTYILWLCIYECMGGKVCQLLCLSFCPFVSVYNIPMTMNVLVCVLSVFVYVC